MENKFNQGRELRSIIFNETDFKTYLRTSKHTWDQTYDQIYWPVWNQTYMQITRYIAEALDEK